jgi:hypothetical protein
MAVEPDLSHTAAMILQAIHAGRIYGFGVMEVTGLPRNRVHAVTVNAVTADALHAPADVSRDRTFKHGEWIHVAGLNPDDQNRLGHRFEHIQKQSHFFPRLTRHYCPTISRFRNILQPSLQHNATASR